MQMLKNLTLQKCIYCLLFLFLFLLPWQTRFIYESSFLNGGFWEYGSSSWYATEVLLWIIILLSFVDLVKRKELWQRIKDGKGNRKSLVFSSFAICYLLFAIFISISPTISFNFVFRLIGAACLVVLLWSTRVFPAWAGKAVRPGVGEAGEWRDTQLSYPPLPRPSGELAALWLGGVVQGLLATWQFFTQKVIHFPISGIAPHLPQDLGAFVIEVGDERWLRAYGSFGSPNILGGFLAIIFLIGLLLYYKTEPGIKKILLTVGQMIITAGLVLSFSRAAWVAAGVGVTTLVIVILSEASESERSRRISLTVKGFLHSLRSVGMTIARPLTFSAALVFILFLAFKPLFLVRTQSTGRLEQQSLITRVEQLKDFKKIFWSPLLSPAAAGSRLFEVEAVRDKEGGGVGLSGIRRALFGVGPGAYTFALFQNNPTLPVWRYQPVHNIYFLILAELGLVGFIGVVLLCCCAVVLTWKHSRLFFPILISFLILGFFDHWLWSMYVGLMTTGAVLGLFTHRS